MTETTTTVPTTDVFPDFAISLEEMTRRVTMLQEYVRTTMVEGEDFGVIPGTSKPTLFKPGAEKLNAIFGLAPMLEVTNRLEDWERGFVSYEVKVTLMNKRTGTVEAEGVGACNSAERRYRTQDAANIANTILKMSKKRALIDATLSATRASGLFTQDLEDLDLDGGNGHAPQRRSTPQRNAPQQRQQQRPPQQQQAATERSSGTLTDAQHRAILAIANRVFGHAATVEDFAGIVDRPVEQLSPADASALIDRLRFMLAEQQQPSRNHNAAPQHRSTPAVRPPADAMQSEQYDQIKRVAAELWGDAWKNELPRHAKDVSPNAMRDFSREEAQQLLDKLRDFVTAQAQTTPIAADDGDPFSSEE